MEYKGNRSKDKMDLLSLNIELGGVEWISCQPPEGLEFEAILSDPYLTDVRCYQLGGIEGTGVFFQGQVGQRTFCMHQEAVRQLYRIDNFFLKRNYYVSEHMQKPTPSSETTDVWGQNVGSPTIYNPGRSPVGLNSAGVQVSDQKATVRKSRVPWSELESDGEDVLSLDTNATDSFLDTGKQMNDIKFLDEDFINGLSTMGQRRVKFEDYISDHRSFSKRDFFLFDYTAMFIDLMDIFEDRSDFKIPLIQRRLDLLNSLEGTSLGYTPMLHTENKGWSSSIKFLCQILSGEYQISFLRVALFISVRKVASQDKLQSAKLNEDFRSFLLGNKSNRNDFTKIIRLNLSALANNKKVLLDVNYVENCLSHVTRD